MVSEWDAGRMRFRNTAVRNPLVQRVALALLYKDEMTRRLTREIGTGDGWGGDGIYLEIEGCSKLMSSLLEMKEMCCVGFGWNFLILSMQFRLIQSILRRHGYDSLSSRLPRPS